MGNTTFIINGVREVLEDFTRFQKDRRENKIEFCQHLINQEDFQTFSNFNQGVEIEAMFDCVVKAGITFIGGMGGR